MHDSVYASDARHIQQLDSRQTNDTKDVKGMKERKRKARKSITGKERERKRKRGEKLEECGDGIIKYSPKQRSKLSPVSLVYPKRTLLKKQLLRRTTSITDNIHGVYVH